MPCTNCTHVLFTHKITMYLPSYAQFTVYIYLFDAIKYKIVYWSLKTWWVLWKIFNQAILRWPPEIMTRECRMRPILESRFSFQFLLLLICTNSIPYMLTLWSQKDSRPSNNGSHEVWQTWAGAPIPTQPSNVIRSSVVQCSAATHKIVNLWYRLVCVVDSHEVSIKRRRSCAKYNGLWLQYCNLSPKFSNPSGSSAVKHSRALKSYSMRQACAYSW